MGFTCKNSVILEHRIFMSNYCIAAGPGNYSALLLKQIESSTDDSPHYEIIEFIEM